MTRRTTLGLALGICLALSATIVAPIGPIDRAGAMTTPKPGVPSVLPPPSPDSEAIGCERAGERLALTRSAHLDHACDWTGGVDIVASDVVLDCRGAHITGGPGRGIVITTPADVSMNGVVVRHCRVEGWLNSVRAFRDGFRTLAEGEEYLHELADITLEHNEFRNSVGVGVYVDAYVSRVTARHNIIEGTGSAGIYLETGSRRNRIIANRIHDNGFRENGPGGQLTTFLGLQFRFWGSGREGVAVDGSYENVIAGNSFEGNSAGGVFLYENCGEFPESDRYFERRYGADGNLIARNTFTGGVHGVWVGQRMGENTLPMECTDPPYFTEPLVSVVLDHAEGNTIAGNRFVDVTYGVRVEDDGTTVRNNRFTAPSPDHHAVVIGTRVRTAALDRPVADTVLVRNRSFIEGNTHPYRWVHGSDGLRVLDNSAGGEAVGICEGEQLPHQLFIWVLALALEPPGAPVTPTPENLAMPTLGALEPCTDPGPPVANPGLVRVTEGDDAVAELPVSLSHAADRTVVLRWRTVWVDGLADQARPGRDYRPRSGLIELDPGQLDGSAQIPIVDDDRPEGAEVLLVSLTRVRNATAGGYFGSGFVLIDDDDD